MEEKRSQIFLYQQRKDIKQSSRPLKLEPFHFNYLSHFARKHKKEIIIFIVLLFFQVILEAILPFLGRDYFSKLSILLVQNKILIIFFVLVIGVVIYLVASFFALKLEKSLVIYLINELRREWFLIYLNKPFSRIKSRDKAALIAKISYHLPLLQMGLGNTLVGIMRWLVYVIGLLMAASFFSSTLLIIVLISLPFNIIIAYLGYLIAKNYVAKETTLYSEIIKHVVSTLYEMPFVQNYQLEKKNIEKFDDLVELDIYFRVRRSLWLIYGNRIIFACLILLTAAFFLMQSYFPQFFSAEKIGEVLGAGIILIYLSRLFYTSLRIGLYILPVQLGLILSVPEQREVKTRKDLIKNFYSLVFQTKKAKLFKSGKYLKNVKLEFKRGEKTLIYGENHIGKTSLGFLLAGFGCFSTRSWIVKVDKERYFYNDWQRRFRNAYFIQPRFSTEKKIGEILIGKYSQDILPEDVERVFKEISKYKEFDFILSLRKFLAADYHQLEISMVNLFSLQAAYCLINKPRLIVIDNFWLDLDYDEINRILKILCQELSKTIFVFFSTKENSLIKYNKKYVLVKKGIEEK